MLQVSSALWALISAVLPGGYDLRKFPKNARKLRSPVLPSESSVKVQCSRAESVKCSVLLVQLEGFNIACGGLRMFTMLARFPFPFKHNPTFRAVSYVWWYIFM
jgi:hypothetical protein